jgi:molybdopterin-guanine dinucleotide biosynthesis protein A
MFSIVIQAGGQSRRMGKDKALLPFLGQTMIERVIERVAPTADEILVTTNNPVKYSFLGLPLFSDLIPDRGALGGLYTALKVANGDYVAVIACDMPFINPELIVAERDRLIDTGADIVIPGSSDGLEPFHAVYRRVICLSHIIAAIEADKWRVDSWFSQVKMEIFGLEETLTIDEDLYSFKNVNSTEELHDAIELARQIDDDDNE